MQTDINAIGWYFSYYKYFQFKKKKKLLWWLEPIKYISIHFNGPRWFAVSSQSIPLVDFRLRYKKKGKKRSGRAGFKSARRSIHHVWGCHSKNKIEEKCAVILVIGCYVTVTGLHFDIKTYWNETGETSLFFHKRFIFITLKVIWEKP